jgi:hypothetical protein
LFFQQQYAAGLCSSSELLESYDDRLESIRRQRDDHKRKLDDFFLFHVEQDYHERKLKELDIEYRQIKMELQELEDKNGSRKIFRKQAYYVKFFFITVKSLNNDHPWRKKSGLCLQVVAIWRFQKIR